jgi:excisionase family DNA binding protein
MLYNITGAAHVLGVSARTVERAMSTGELKCRRIGSRVRFAREDLEQYAGGALEADAEKAAVPLAERGRGIPPEILMAFEKELDGISHGSVTLTVHFRDGRPRFVIGREQSFFSEGAGITGRGT